MEVVNNYFKGETFDEQSTIKHINFLRSNNLKLNITKQDFDKLPIFEKKKLYSFIESDEIKSIKLDFLTNVNSFKDSNLLTRDEMEFFYFELERLYEDVEILKSFFVDPYNFSRFSKFYRYY